LIDAISPRDNTLGLIALFGELTFPNTINIESSICFLFRTEFHIIDLGITYLFLTNDIAIFHIDTIAKALSYIFIDRFLCALYNEGSKGRCPFVKKL